MPELDAFSFFDPASGRTITITPVFVAGDLTPAEPIVVMIADAIALVSPDPLWFLVRLDDGGLAIAHPVLVDGHAQWQLVDDEDYPAISLAANGMPEKYERIICPVCAADNTITWDVSKRLVDLVVICAGCGYRIEDPADNVADDDDRDSPAR